MAKQTVEQRLKRIAFAGFVLAKSKRYQSALARASGISQQMIAMIASGERPLTPMVEERIGKGLISTAKKMREHAARIEDMGHRILHNMEK